MSPGSAPSPNCWTKGPNAVGNVGLDESDSAGWLHSSIEQILQRSGWELESRSAD
jgi:hypothetical protein